MNLTIDTARQLSAAMFDREQQVADWYVLLWSHTHNGFHIEPHRQMLDANRRAYAEDRRMDYVPIFIGTQDACSRMADTLRDTVRQREDGREAARIAIAAARTTASQKGVA